MKPRHIGQKYVAGIGVAVLVFLAGCTPEVPTAPVPVQAAAGPIITSDQEDRIMNAIAEAFVAGDTAGSIEPIASRVTSPATEMRSAQYIISAANGDPGYLEPLSFEPAISIISATDQWPRFFMVMSATPADAKAPFLMVVQQESPREPYKLWGWTRMLKTALTPAVAAASDGVVAVAPDATGFQATPAQAVAQYADVRQNRDQSAYTEAFAPDKLRSDLDPYSDALAASISGAGTVTNTFVPVENQVFAIKTNDGGAWVVGLIKNDFVATVTNPGAKLEVKQPTTKGLSAAESFGTAVTISSFEVMSFYVPPEGSMEQITVIGGQHTTVAVSGE